MAIDLVVSKGTEDHHGEAAELNRRGARLPRLAVLRGEAEHEEVDRPDDDGAACVDEAAVDRREGLGDGEAAEVVESDRDPV